MVPFELLGVSLDEAWALRDYVRDHEDQGCEWDKDFDERVMGAILEAMESVGKCSTLMCCEEELWQVHRQIPPALMVGTKPVGRDLLVKVMRLIVKLRSAEGGFDDAGTSEDAPELKDRRVGDVEFPAEASDG